MDPTTLTPAQIDQLRQGLTAIGLLQPGSTDQQVQTAFLQYNATNSAGAVTIWAQAGLPAAGLAGLPWLPIIGVIGGLIAVYFIWQANSGGAKQVDAYEYPEPDTKHQLRSMSKVMGRLGGARRLGRFGATHKPKYEFEPEIRLEGIRRKRARR